MSDAGLLGRLLPLVVVFLTARASSASAAELSDSEYTQTAWRIEDGLPQSTVFSVAQTPDGFLWFATQEGLVRFDGERFDVVDSSNGLNCNLVEKLLVDDGGRLWIGAHGCGLTSHSGGVVEHFATRAGLRDDRVQSLAIASSGGLWVGTDHGVAHFVDRRFEFMNVGDSEIITAIVEDAAGVWVGTAEGLKLVAQDGVYDFSGDPAIAHHAVSALAVDGGTLWIGTKSHGLVRRRDGRLQPFPLGDERAKVRALLPHEGELWVGTDGAGLLRIRGDRVTPVLATAGAAVESIFIDRENSIWFGTQTDGLHQLRPRRFAMVDQVRATEAAWSLTEDRDGALWIGTDRALYRLLGDQQERFAVGGALPDATIQSLLSDRHGDLWIGTAAGLARRSNGRFTTLTERDGMPAKAVHAPIHSIIEDRRGDLWIGTQHGLTRWRDGRVIAVYTHDDGLANDEIIAIVDDGAGGLWLGSPGGIDHFSNDRVIGSYTMRDGLRDSYVNFLMRDRDGTLWAATGGGLTRIRHGVLRTMATDRGLAQNEVLGILDGSHGEIWITSNAGIYTIDRHELEDKLDQPAGYIAAHRFGRADGLRSVECNSNSQSATLRSRDGRVWFPMIGGVATIRPDARKLNPVPPPAVVVDKARVGGVWHDLAAGLTLPLGARDLELRYAALSFVDPRAVRFRYQLEGLDTDWVDAVGRRIAYYTNLQPGHYRFRVSATNGDGTWALHPAVLEFDVPARLHERRWFLPSCALVVVLLVFAGASARLRALGQRELELQLRVKSRTAELAESNRQLQGALATAARGEASLRGLIERLPDALAIMQDDRVVYANPASMSLMGYSELGALDAMVRDGLYCEPEDRKVGAQRLAQAFAGSAIPMREMKLRCSDGTFRTCEVSSIPISYGQRPAIVALARDVTDRRQLEARLAVAGRMASVGTMAAGIAHEINNPLAFVIGNLEFIAEQLRITGRADLDSAIGDARDGAERVRRIVQDVRVFSRLEEEKNARIALDQVITAAAKIAMNEIKHRARLITDFAPACVVVGNEARLGQVFVNLLVNAAHSIRPGAAEQNEIRIATRYLADGRVEATVSDTGVGIPQENIDRIFDPFFTTKLVGEGTGLGLSICHGIVSAHGGTITVESAVGKGSLFRVTFAAPPQEQVEPASPKGTPSVVETPRRTTLLVIDDEVMIGRILKRALTKDYDVVTVTSGPEALSLLAERPFDLVLSDLMMPQMTGMELYREISRRALHPPGGFIFLTGGAFTAEARAFLDGVNAPCLPKPFELDHVRRILADAVAAARAPSTPRSASA